MSKTCFQHDAAWRSANAGHVSLGQMKVMSAIERCRTAARPCEAWLRHDAAMSRAARTRPAVTRSSPTTAAATDIVPSVRGQRHASGSPIGRPSYSPSPGPIADVAYQNKRVIYDLLFKAAAETTLTIAADAKHLGARIGITAVLHTWGSASCRRRASDTMTHHPHLHMIVPGGGLSDDGSRWVSCRPNFFLPVRVLSRLFRRLFLEMLVSAHAADQLKFHGDHAALADAAACRLPGAAAQGRVGGLCQEAVRWPSGRARHLSRYTHRVAISNRRLVSADDTSVTFRWKDYRIEGSARHKTMTLPTGEFIRRFLMHVLPKGFHRIRRALKAFNWLDILAPLRPTFCPTKGDASPCHGECCCIALAARRMAKLGIAPHVKVWLSPLALRLVVGARELTGSEWLFPLSNKDAPMRTPNIVDLLKAAREVIGIEDFRLHDLRRTAATYMGEMGVADRDIEGILNHISAQRGITRRHYDKARREHPKREAMLLWSAHLEALIEGREGVQAVRYEPAARYHDMSRHIGV